MNAPLPRAWLNALSLAQRTAPDFFRYGDEIADVPHAAAMRLSMKMGVSAIHCIQGVPTIAFVVLEEEDTRRIDRLHADLWNQGLMSLLLVIAGDRLQAYTLTRKPVDPELHVGIVRGNDARLLDTLSLLENALDLRDFVTGVESGRLFRDRYPSVLDAAERVDGVLLDNLMASHRLLLAAGMDEAASQALLMQAMFIAYLEDRGVITGGYFREATGEAKIDGLRALLRAGRPEMLRQLFLPLYEHFNGDLFHSPCAFGAETASCELTPEHLSILDEFIWGEWELGRKQRRFWSYRFRYIPVELISAVYDRMLAENAKQKKADGAFYTPMFLADLVVDQAWGLLSETQRHAPEILDPACGSGVFLVRMFERLVEHRRAQAGGKLPWHSLKALVGRLHGWDKNPMTVRIAAFSLYLALLEQREPREIRQLMDEGKLLPPLWGHNLKAVDFFAQAPKQRFDLIIGNPPWNSRTHKLPEAIAWCEANGYPIPQEQSAWGFVWKAREHTKESGLIAFLLPSMGFLHNEASIPARRRWFREVRIERFINFADQSFLLFDGAKAATTLALYRPSRSDSFDYRFDYWCPKADITLQTRRLLTVSHSDQCQLRLGDALIDTEIFKRRLWMGSVEMRLFDYLSSLPRLESLIAQYKNAPSNIHEKRTWKIGEGFIQAQEDRLNEAGYRTSKCTELTSLPFLPTEHFHEFVMPSFEASPWSTETVYRKGFLDGFIAPHILLPHGIVRKDGRLRAAYSEQDCCFFHSIRAISVPGAETKRAKLLTAILNSRLSSFFLLNDTAGFGGVERARPLETDVLRIPFPDTIDLEDTDKATKASDSLVGLLDELLTRKDRLLDEEHWPATVHRLDELVYTYYGLTEDEIVIIEETFDEIIPAIQPNKSKRPSLWNDCSSNDQTRYLRELESSLAKWMTPGTLLNAEVLANSQDAAIVRVHLGGEEPGRHPQEGWNALLDRLWPRLDRRISRNLQVISDLRFFDGDDLYLFKPRKRRFWLRTTAMNDAAAIAGELMSQPEERTE